MVFIVHMACNLGLGFNEQLTRTSSLGYNLGLTRIQNVDFISSVAYMEDVWLTQNVRKKHFYQTSPNTYSTYI